MKNIMVNMTAEYICKNYHRTSYPYLDIEAQENNQTKQTEAHLLCKTCGADLEFDRANASLKTKK
ncbi:MAG: hypothetical protein Q7S12_00180 [bacterium]|nr:hypothetical protein [bacterium]